MPPTIVPPTIVPPTIVPPTIVPPTSVSTTSVPTPLAAPSPLPRRAAGLAASWPAGALALLVVLAAATGCSDTFTPPSVVEDLRVMALVASPPELGPPAAGPAQAVSVEALLAAPLPGAPAAGSAGLTERWSFCPLSAGASAAYACAVSACEVELTPTGRTVTVEPMTEIAACLARLGGVLPGEAGGALPATLEVLVRYEAQQAGGPKRAAVQRIPVWTGSEAPPSTWGANRQPVLTGVTIGGVAATPCPDAADTTGCPASGTLGAADLAVVATVDPASIDTVTEANGRSAQESVVVWFFTTAGRFTEERGAAPVATTALQRDAVPAGATAALLWVVARDLRGGEALAGPYRLAIAP